MEEISKEKKFHIIIDNREPKEIMNGLGKEGIDVKVESLDVGDYVISDCVAIERKTGADLVQSIKESKRNLFEQLMRISETYESPILLIEDLKSAFRSQMDPSSIYGVITSIAQRSRIPIVPTLNIEDTIIALKRMVIREQKEEDEPFILARRAPKMMTLEERQMYYVEGLYNIGPKRAKLLLENFLTPDGIHKAIKNTKPIYSKTGKVKGIEGELCKVKGIGANFILKNQDLIFGNDKKSSKSQKRLKDVCVSD